jgi:hypothetical protein
MRAFVHAALAAVAAALIALIASAGCSNNPASCSAPSSGTFHVTLSYSQTIPVDLFCDAGGIDASACSSHPHVLDGASWTVTVNGGTASIASTGAALSCTATAPRAAPEDQPDGASQAGTGCYLLLECGPQALGDAGAALVQVQLLTQSSSDDVLALVHDESSDCCTDEYTGAWH